MIAPFSFPNLMCLISLLGNYPIKRFKLLEQLFDMERIRNATQSDQLT